MPGKSVKFSFLLLFGLEFPASPGGVGSVWHLWCFEEITLFKISTLAN